MSEPKHNSPHDKTTCPACPPAYPASKLDELEEYGATLWRMRENYAQVMDGARQRALAAVDDGVPEQRVAKLLGVDRMTVRKWQGKDGHADIFRR